MLLLTIGLIRMTINNHLNNNKGKEWERIATAGHTFLRHSPGISADDYYNKQHNNITSLSSLLLTIALERHAGM